MSLKKSTASFAASHDDNDDDAVVRSVSHGYIVMLRVEAESSARKHQGFVADSPLSGDRSDRWKAYSRLAQTSCYSELRGSMKHEHVCDDG